jgi:hypothetical protein
MKTRLAIVGLFLSGSWLWTAAAAPGLTSAETLFDSPLAFVSPTSVDFGVVYDGEFATNSVIVENVGRGKLIGTATVEPPFRILSGANYKLDRSAAQVVTIVYTPSGIPTNIAKIKFSGAANEVSATLVGRLSSKPRPYHWKRK